MRLRERSTMIPIYDTIRPGDTITVLAYSGENGRDALNIYCHLHEIKEEDTAVRVGDTDVVLRIKQVCIASFLEEQTLAYSDDKPVFIVPAKQLYSVHVTGVLK